MYARPQTRPKPRRSQLKSFSAPVAGWISNRALARPQEPGQAQGAAILDNFFPRATGVILRRGSRLYATLGDGSKPALSLFSYNTGAIRRLFGATDEMIAEITTIQFADNGEIVNEDGDYITTEDGDYFGWSSTEPIMSGYTGGNWIVAQFATTGGIYLIGVNGVDEGFIYDGTNFYPNAPGGMTAIPYDGLVVPFTVGATVVGSTSGASATIYRVEEDRLIVRNVLNGPFDDGETIIDTDSGSATVSDATYIAAPGVTFPDGLTTADMSYVWTYKNRLWFAQTDSMNAWYLEQVDAIGGNAAPFPLAGVFARGGTLLFGQSWSLEAGGEGGLSEQVVFVSDEGEVAVYQGSDPAEAATWSKVGVYRIGKPLGNRAFLRGGGDLAISTSVGLVPLSKAIQLDVTSLNTATVSYGIADAWSDATELRSLNNWQAELWPEQKMALIAPPATQDAPLPVVFVSNTETGAWARFTGWDAKCMEVFGGRLFFGGSGGKVLIANVGGDDQGETYTGSVLPLYEDLGSPASLKVPTMGRAVVRGTTKIPGQVRFMSDFGMVLPDAPDAVLIASVANIWGTGKWGSSVWGGGLSDVVSMDWSSLGGRGAACSIAYQVTSGEVQPLDAEVTRLDMLFTAAEMVT
ncbi:MAG: hypothetical protein EON59_05415 [Alphaproteobacteria bacterium]|nr:MAG: hypothetical protein EON59_05415 [Alphaproteobacteria bacterium]